MRRATHCLAPLLLVAACGKGKGDPPSGFAETYAQPKYYFSSVKTVQVEVLYEEGAEPFTGNGPKGRTMWALVTDNLNALFKGRKTVPKVLMPDTLPEMTKIPAQGKKTWATDELTTVAQQYRSGPSTEETAKFTIVFLNGNSEKDDGSPDPDVIGFNVSRTPYVAMFNSVIREDGDKPVSRFIQTSTVIHELGHALGLVDNGVPLYAKHLDAEHGAHCTNDRCVMYWANEGKATLQKFIEKFQEQQSTVAWGEECLDDVTHYAP